MKIAFVCEGQSELIFLQQLIVRSLDLSAISLECFGLSGEKLNSVPYTIRNDAAIFHILIVSANNDNKVASYLNESYGLLSQKYDLIVGVRDVYSAGYACRIVDTIEVGKFKRRIRKAVKERILRPKLFLVFMQMELESWFLSYHDLLLRFLNKQEIGDVPELSGLGDPEKILHPYPDLQKIVSKYGLEYSKKFDHVASIASHIMIGDIARILESRLKGRSLRVFMKTFRRVFDLVLL